MVKSFDYSSLSVQDRELYQWGQNLPLGIFLNGDRLREYTLKPYIGHHDVLLGRLEDENRETPDRLIRIFSQFLPQIVETIDGWPLAEVAAKLNTSPPRLFQGMYLADILSLLLNVRCKGTGPQIAIPCTCPYCGHKINHRESGDLYTHDLSSVILRGCDTLLNPPLFHVQLARPVDNTDKCYWEPPRFKEVSLEASDAFSKIKLQAADALISMSDEMLDKLHYRDYNKIQRAIGQMWFGPEQTIPMDCPSCRGEWVSFVNSDFYFSTFTPPRPNQKIGSVEKYFNELDFFFRTGEQAPRNDVFEMTPSSREFWIKKLSEMYKKQKEEMDKSAAKSKSRR
jgi:hypothetical protein